MNIVIAVDSFKGCLSSLEAGNIVLEAARKVLGESAAIKVFPLADGGEGTVDALTSGLEHHLASADIVITGEGCLDQQTAMGKAPLGVARLAKKLHPKVCTIAVCGSAKPEADAVNSAGIDAYFPILHLPMSTAEAMEKETARRNLYQTVEQILRLRTA